MNFLSYVSIVFSVTLLNNLLFVQSAISPVYPSTCITCASESLLSKWSATSLPAPPSSFDTAKFFTSDCDSVDIQNVLTLKSVKCDSPCFATTIYTVGAINVVRGCMDDFFPDESISEAKSQITKVGEATNAQYCSMDIAAETHLEDQYAVNYCVTITPAGAAEPLACNAKPAVTKSGTVIDLTCTQANGDAKDIDCYKCSNQNGNGECAASDSSKCKGKFCTKTSGTIGDTNYMERDCAKFNLYLVDRCDKHTYQVPISVSPYTTINQTMINTDCICGNTTCNSASTIMASSFLFLFASIAAYVQL